MGVGGVLPKKEQLKSSSTIYQQFILIIFYITKLVTIIVTVITITINILTSTIIMTYHRILPHTDSTQSSASSLNTGKEWLSFEYTRKLHSLWWFYTHIFLLSQVMT